MKRALFLLLLATSVAFAQRPTGTFTLGKQVAGPVGFLTHSFKVTECAGLEDSSGQGNGEIAIRYPALEAGTPVAYDVFVHGHGGQNFWSYAETVNTPILFNKLIQRNHVVIQIRWTGTGWFGAPLGEEWGFQAQAARPATAFKWVHDNLSRGVKLQVSGGSGGSTQIGYALSSYWSDQYIDTAILISGPPFARLAEGCLKQSGWEYADRSAARPLVDVAFGFVPTTGPCMRKDPSWASRWKAESVDTGGTKYAYPNTTVHFIEGAHDSYAEIQHRENDFLNVLVFNHQQDASLDLIPNMKHSIQFSPEGMDKLFQLLTTP